MEELLCFRFWVFMFSMHCFVALLALSGTNFTTDKLALVALKSSITGDGDPHHFLSHNWSASSSVCNWVGVTCDAHHGRVRTLNLGDMGISGTLPSQLGNLTFLVELDLSGNSFHDQLPDQLVQLRRLKSLNLSRNEFSGDVPAWIGGLSALRYLNLSHNKFGGFIPKSLSNLTMLEILDWNYNLIQGTIPLQVGKMTHLRVLFIAANSLTGTIPPTISNLSSLEKISLSYNSLSGGIPREIGELPRLRIMYLGDNPLTGSVPLTIFNHSLLQHIALGSSNLSGTLPSNLCLGLSKLQLLYLSFNRFSGKMPTVWHPCRELTGIDLSENMFSRGSIPLDIGNLTALASLYLAWDNLEGEISSSLFNISSMRVLVLRDNNLNGSLTEKMFHQLPMLDYLSLSDNQFVGNIPKSISNCTMLEELYLGANNFAGSIPEEIGGLPVLSNLSIGNNHLNGSIPSKIFNMTSLRYLFLANNSLSGFLPSFIGLENLEVLYLFENQLRGDIPSSMSNASKLTRVYLRLNKFNGVIPKALGNLRYLQWLDVAYNNLTTDASTIESSFPSSLKYLHISRNPMHGHFSKSIGNMSHLEQLLANFCNIGGKIPLEIGNLSKVFKLSLYHNDLSGPIPKTINGLQSLQYLSLGNNQLQGTIIDELCVINQLGELYITENKLISGAIPACFGNFTSLRKLYLNSNKLNQVPFSLWSLRDILGVNLSDNALTGFLPLDIGNLKAVTLLDVSKNQISGSIPRAITGLQNLQMLNLAQNKLLGIIPDSFGNLISLTYLDLSQNHLFGVIPKSMESLQYLKFINLSYNMLEGEIPNGGPFKSFTAESFIFNKALCGNARLHVSPCSQMKRKRSNANLFIKFILPVMLSTILIVSSVFLLVRHRRQRKNNGDPTEVSLPTLQATRRISYNELSQATNGFDDSNLLGKGSFGSVFKGILPNGMVVAVKLFNLDVELGSKSFDVECEAMRNLRHRNLVKVIGSCSNDDYKLLVMDFMPNGSLERWLYSHNYHLDFLQRLNIMIDVASALDYMHHGSSPTVVHCDVKPSNVLLDEDMVAHVSDFGIAKLLDEGQSKEYTKTIATLGYIAPEYGSKGTISTKGDVYSFGIMLMETFTRKKPTDELFVAGLSMKDWISESLPHAITRVVGSNLLRDEVHHTDDITSSLSSIFRLALNCCADLPEERMNMTDVAASLNKIKVVFQAHAT